MIITQIIAYSALFCSASLFGLMIIIYTTYNMRMKKKVKQETRIRKTFDEMIEEETCMYVDETGLHETFAHPI